MTTALDKVLAQLPIVRREITSLKYEYAHTRLTQYALRRNILERLHIAERRYHSLYAKYLSLDGIPTLGDLHKPVKPIHGTGIRVTLELSLDGISYSNPAPRVAAGTIVWIRAIIDEGHRGDTGLPKTHEMFHLRWTIGRGYRPLDTIPRSGHDVYAVCWPLVIVRKFRAPSSHTSQHFQVDADPYARFR